MLSCGSICGDDNANAQVPMPLEADGTPVECRQNVCYENWGRTVDVPLAYMFYPKSKKGLCEVVKFSNKVKLPIRAAGFRHSWSEVFGQNGGIMVSILSEREAGMVGIFPTHHPDLDNSDKWRCIEIIGEEFERDGKKRCFVRVGAGITNRQARLWALERDKNNLPAYCLESSVVMEENTMAGMVSNMCHGAGIWTQTVSDRVVELEVVNPLGELQIISDPEILRSAAGSFGLFGIITSITFDMERMPYAEIEPTKTPLMLAVPPPREYKIPNCIPSQFTNDISEARLEKARNKVRDDILNSDYWEMFWFPYQENAWTNVWNQNGKREESVLFPNETHRCFDETLEYSAQLFTPLLFKFLSDKTEAEFLANVAMLCLPTKKLTVAKPNAMHFRGGVNEYIVQDMEIELEIPLDRDGKLDFDVVLRAWQDGLKTFYEFDAIGKTPMKMPLEMRVMGGSNMTMAAQRGNAATLAIEFLTIHGTPSTEFFQALLDKWSSYTNFEGRPLRCIPHFAKQSQGLTIQRVGDKKRRTMNEYFREIVFKPVLPLFMKHAKQVAEAGGYTVEAMFNKFSNPYLDSVVLNRKPKKALKQSVELVKLVNSLKTTSVDHGITHTAVQEIKVPADIHDEKSAAAHLTKLHERARRRFDEYVTELASHSAAGKDSSRLTLELLGAGSENRVVVERSAGPGPDISLATWVARDAKLDDDEVPVVHFWRDPSAARRKAASAEPVQRKSLSVNKM